MVIKNVGAFDAGIRAILSVALLVLAASLPDRPLLALGAAFVAISLLGTALVRVCPLYTALKINTCPRDGLRHSS
jgi:hypothetical protein